MHDDKDKLEPLPLVAHDAHTFQDKMVAFGDFCTMVRTDGSASLQLEPRSWFDVYLSTKLMVTPRVLEEIFAQPIQRSSRRSCKEADFIGAASKVAMVTDSHRSSPLGFLVPAVYVVHLERTFVDPFIATTSLVSLQVVNG